MTQDQDDAAPTAGAGRRRSARRVSGSRAGSRRDRKAIAGKRRAATPHHTVAKVITATLVTLGLGTGAGVVVVYNNWNGNLQKEEIDGQLRDRPSKKDFGPQEPLNILVMGSDTREGEGNNVDGMNLDGERSDTTILVHLSRNRKFAYGISIPRDTVVDRPDCYEEDGTTVIPGEEDAMWNTAFAVGGPACTVQQLEQVSGIRVDNYVTIDFGGFKEMVDALDGVEVCIPETIDDPETNIHLEAGTREIEGDEALAYVRVRKIGNGIDPDRIRRQQAFLASMINKAVSGGMLVRPDRLKGFVDALTESITTNFENVAQLVNLGRTFAGVGLDDVKFVTTPWEFSVEHEGRVEWTSEVEDLWQLVIDDEPLTDNFVEDSISAAEEPDGSDGTESPDATESTDPTDEPSGDGGGKQGGKGNKGEQTDEPDQGLSDDARADAKLCT